jgi:hypothetical protein
MGINKGIGIVDLSINIIGYDFIPNEEVLKVSRNS